MFRLALLSLISAVAMAASKSIELTDVKASSRLGRKLLKKASVVQKARNLDGNQQDNYFLTQHYIKYLGCSSTVNYDMEGGGGDESPLYAANLVKFALCPDGCSSCSGGGMYVVSMMDFVDAYTEMQLSEQEYRCEMRREQCEYNQNCYQDDQYCEQLCYSEVGMDECIEYEGQEEFEIQRYLECAEIENNNNNNNQNQYNQNQNNGNNNQNQNGNANYWYEYFVGMYCAADGKTINLGVFSDEGCVNFAADQSIFYQRTGMELPFSSESIVDTSECMSCIDPENERENQQNGNNNNNNNNGNAAEPSQLCEETYERAAKCETNMDLWYKDESGCNFINNYLPKIEGAGKTFASSSSGGKAAGFAWLFALTTILFGAYSYFLYRKIKRGSVNLAAQDGAIA